jgi:hypothetical protein
MSTIWTVDIRYATALILECDSNLTQAEADTLNEWLEQRGKTNSNWTSTIEYDSGIESFAGYCEISDSICDNCDEIAEY